MPVTDTVSVCGRARAQVERRNAQGKGHNGNTGSERGRVRESGGAQTCHGSRYGSIWASHQALGALTCCGLNPDPAGPERPQTIQSCVYSVNSIQTDSSHSLLNSFQAGSSCAYITQANMYCSVSILSSISSLGIIKHILVLTTGVSPIAVASRPMHDSELLIIIPRLSLAVHEPSPQKPADSSQAPAALPPALKLRNFDFCLLSSASASTLWPPSPRQTE